MGTIQENPFPFSEVGGLQLGVVNPTPVASTTAMPAPVAGVTTVSGTTAITTIATPWPDFTGTIRYIPTGTFSGTTAGAASGAALPIGLAFTAVVGKVLDLTCDGLKWYPSYVS